MHDKISRPRKCVISTPAQINKINRNRVAVFIQKMHFEMESTANITLWQDILLFLVSKRTGKI